MKTTLLAALFLLPAAAHATPDSLQQLQDCAAGQCWDTKGQPVTVPPAGAVIIKEPARVRSAWDKKPAEPPRYTVLTKEEVQKARERQTLVGTVIAGGVGAMLGAMVGGVPGALIGALVGAGAAYLFLHAFRKA